jgi:TfoX/Sxy family transcriptional regulator of competence genes
VHRGGSERPSPKASDDAKAQFRTLVPEDDRVTVKPMFGAVAAFTNGWMFMGLFAADLFVRLDEADTAAGGGPLEPMPGKPMKGYVTIPNWRSDPESVRTWGQKALDYTLTLPPKNK